MKGLSAALLIVTAPALAQQAPSGPPLPANPKAAAMMQALQAYGRCQGAHKAKLAATVTPEEAAATIFSACGAMAKAMIDVYLAGFPQDQWPAEQAYIKSEFGEKAIANTIRKERATQANQQCISGHIEKLAATVTPEAGAATIFSACAAQREAVLKAKEAEIAMNPPNEWQAPQLALLRAESANGEKEIADAIRKQRGAPPAPAPAQ